MPPSVVYAYIVHLFCVHFNSIKNKKIHKNKHKIFLGILTNAYKYVIIYYIKYDKVDEIAYKCLF